MDKIINYYSNNDEEGRITSSNSRKVEFLITTNILDKYIESKDRILEVGAGVGVYSFYYANKGNEVIATDLTPKNVDTINEKLLTMNKKVNLSAKVVNATDLSIYKSESFDVVTCLGPLYHIIDDSQRKKCIEESLRVLKKGGILALAYINKHYIMNQVMLRNKESLNKSFIDKILETGIIKDGEKGCFWTDAFFTTPSEIEEIISEYNVKILEHVSTDGITPLFRQAVDAMNEDEYNGWIYYLLKSCRNRDILGMSNHALILIEK